ncbi:oxidoreductase [Caldimonas brevitalea]|uniref:Oxidoreductase n=1 Tax=Caldimonas brevitalea TaxID=413882 RepID=A0A0G3BSD5_9BURK|nr:oxidoreductase [Caldimonas brevitalea]AKJ30291.1 oxidoreductase [Caldimonas brevitalea]
MNTLRVGLLGYGYASKTFHAPLIAGVPGLQLAAVSSRDAAKVHADWPGLTVEPTPEALIARPDLDLIVVPTPNPTHHPLAKAALLAGKHVVVDKPFTVTLAEARELDALARHRRRVLSVFHNRRWDGDFLGLRALLDAGSLGRVVHFESHFDRFRPQVRARWREQSGPGAGLWYDLGPHLVDQALQLFGVPDAVTLDLAVLRDGAETDDYFHAQLRYERLRVVLHASSLSAAPGPRFVMHGTRGSYVKHGLDPQEDLLKGGARPSLQALGDWGSDSEPGRLTLEDTSQQAVAAPAGNHLAYYAALRDALWSGGPPPVTAEDAIAVMAVIEAGSRSAAERREVALQRLPGLPREAA